MCYPGEWERDREKGCAAKREEGSAARGGEGCTTGTELAWGIREWSWRGEEERGS
jgi:hypothetical protein